MKLALLLLLAISALGQTSVYVNVGSSTPYTDSGGNVWVADNGSICSSSTLFNRGITIGTPDPTLYQTGRTDASTIGCNLTVSTPGFYFLTFKFSETDPTIVRAGQRIFNVIVNNQVFIRNFDILANCPIVTACDRSVGPIAQASGVIIVQVTNVNNAPVLQGISAVITGFSAGGGSGGTVTNVSGGGPAWLNWAISSPTTTPNIVVTPGTGQASHQVIGTCNALTSFQPCTLVVSDLPASPVTPGSYIDTNITVDGFGRITAAANGPNSVAGGTCAVQFNVGGAFTGDAVNLCWDNTLKNLGLGASPGGYKLDVAKSGTVGTARFLDQTASTGSTRIDIQNGAGQPVASCANSLINVYDLNNNRMAGLDCQGTYFVANLAASKKKVAMGGGNPTGNPAFVLTSDSFVQWKNVDGLDTAGAYDVALARNAAGVLEIDSTTAGTYRDLKLRASNSTGYAFAGLPAAAAGNSYYCTDCTVTSSVDNTAASGGAGCYINDIGSVHKCVGF